MGRFFLPFEETEQKQNLSATIGAPTGRPSLEFAISSDRMK